MPSDEPFHQHEAIIRDGVQVGWRDHDSGARCCPYEPEPTREEEVPAGLAEWLQTEINQQSAKSAHWRQAGDDSAADFHWGMADAFTLTLRRVEHSGGSATRGEEG